ncbi:MFS general substrate transporter [Trichoderma asperelloides]|nr:MFS general substrate transporter [Trichoderma asperelloides]
MHIVFFNTWGVANGYGVFQEYYTQTLGESQSSISWIGSVQVFFLFSVGVIAGRLTDAGHFRVTFACGVFLQLLGIFMTSLCKTYWQIFLAQAVCLGIGNGFSFCSSLAILSQYFKKYRAFAVGLSAAGASVGSLVYPVMFKPRLPPRKTGQWTDTSAFTDFPFILFSISMFLNFWGLYFAFFYLGTFARDTIGTKKPIDLPMILNGVGIIGRTLPTIVADRHVGMLNMLIPMSFALSLVMYCWAAVSSTAGLYVFAIVYGLIAASLQALFPAVSTTMTPHPSPAICGAIIQGQKGSYLGAQMFAASCIFLGALTALGARIAKVGFKLKIKV